MAVALVASNFLRPPPPAPLIDQDLIIGEAVEAGFVAPEDVAALQENLERTQADLEAVREERPDLRAEVDRAIEAVNANDPDAAAAAFAEANAVIEAEAREARLEQARLKNAEANLLYPFEASKSAPLLCAAAAVSYTHLTLPTS